MNPPIAESLRDCFTAALGLMLGSALISCGPPAFSFTVTFRGEAEIEAGAVVRYQGVEVGEVSTIALQQSDPKRPALVELLCSIDDTTITIRRDDLFEVASDGLMGDSYLRITPAEGDSPALQPGSTVIGIPPLVTRVRESAEETLESLGSLAKEKAGAFLDALSQEAPPGSDAPNPTPNSP